MAGITLLTALLYRLYVSPGELDFSNDPQQVDNGGEQGPGGGGQGGAKMEMGAKSTSKDPIKSAAPTKLAGGNREPDLLEMNIKSIKSKDGNQPVPVVLNNRSVSKSRSSKYSLDFGYFPASEIAQVAPHKSVLAAKPLIARAAK